MDSHFKISVQQLLTENIAPFVATEDGGRKGGLVGNEVPWTPERFEEQLRAEAAPYKVDGWMLDAIEQEDVIADALIIYNRYYAGWVKVDLAGDAPPNVRAWQAEARKG
jgi:hypothetical protein